MPGSRAKGTHARWILSAVGRIRLRRGYRVVGRDGGYPADAVLGIGGYVSGHAQRMATLAGLQRSFAHAESLLGELCGWRLDDNTIRQLTHAAAKRAQQERATRADAGPFADAAGDPEVAIDAGKVNTTDGWRDVKVAVICKREAGEAATPGEWDSRELPAPTIRSVVAAIEEAEHFRTRVRRETDRLGVTTATACSVLADGAEWIWHLAGAVLPQASGVLDIYHALGHVGAAVKEVWGEAPEGERHRSAGTRALVSGGKEGIERWIGEAMASAPEGRPTDALLGLAAYLANHPRHLDYAVRLSRGQSIGSGQVEGAIKELVNLRLKRTGARWRWEHVGPLVELIALSDTPEWHRLWTAACKCQNPE